jgi:hypothetical protein
LASTTSAVFTIAHLSNRIGDTVASTNPFKFGHPAAIEPKRHFPLARR